MKSNKKNLSLSGNLWINSDDHNFLGGNRIKLLEKIDELGSITKAAKAVGISYKTAWDTISAINNLAEKSLVDSLTGGKGGGGTCLTPEGKLIVAQFNTIQQELRCCLDNLQEKFGNITSLSKFLLRNSIKVSARNTFVGTVTDITKGAVNTEVILQLRGGIRLTSIITNSDVEKLELAIGMDAYAIVKASSIIIGTDLGNSRISASNIFNGTVARVIKGAVNAEVDVKIDDNTMISAIITLGSATELGLKQGDHASVLFKASDVMLGVN
jgi:molybdate transport system regulatory protein